MPKTTPIINPISPSSLGASFSSLFMAALTLRSTVVVAIVDVGGSVVVGKHCWFSSTGGQLTVKLWLKFTYEKISPDDYMRNDTCISIVNMSQIKLYSRNVYYLVTKALIKWSWVITQMSVFLSNFEKSLDYILHFRVSYFENRSISNIWKSIYFYITTCIPGNTWIQR